MALTELIAAVVFVFAALIICVLLIPFYFSFYLNRKESDFKGDVEIAWLSNIIKKRFELKKDAGKLEKEKAEKGEDRGEGDGKKGRSKEEEGFKKEKKREKGAGNIADNFNKFFENSQYIPYIADLGYPVFRFIKDILISIKIQKLKLNITAGFSDPCYTGYLAGLVYFLDGITSAFSIKPDINIEPDFNQIDAARFDFLLIIVFKARLLDFLISLARLIISKPVRRLAWKVFVSKAGSIR